MPAKAGSHGPEEPPMPADPAGIEWLAPHELPGCAAARDGRVVDVRPADAFACGHVRGALSRPLDPAVIDAGPGAVDYALGVTVPSILLPARHEPLVVIAGDRDTAGLVAGLLHARGRERTLACAIAADDAVPPTLREVGPRSGTLWSPPAFLARWAHLLPPPAHGPVLDLGCGSGRAAVWLARRGYRVTAVDHQEEALALGRQLAGSAGVRVDWRRADLREADALPAGPWSAALMFRYLERPLVRALGRVLAPGATVMLRTFRHAPGYIGNPRPRHRLARGEAAGLWPTARVLVHEEGFDADGKPAAGVVVRWTG
ncbi:methyltransferase domain-containing protein [bacterium]|nr:methyltransferase domain-containing protein [bacterium]